MKYNVKELKAKLNGKYICATEFTGYHDARVKLMVYILHKGFKIITEHYSFFLKHNRIVKRHDTKIEIVDKKASLEFFRFILNEEKIVDIKKRS